ncbi:MAG: PEP-CTERM sorting domain-containing protein [Planctomycetota bacterium]
MVALFVCVVAPFTADAATVSYQLEGQVTVINNTGPMPPTVEFGVGDAYTFTFEFDPDAALTGNPGGNVSNFNAVVAGTFTIPSRGLTIEFVNPVEVAVSDFLGIGPDVWSLQPMPQDLSSTVPSQGTASFSFGPGPPTLVNFDRINFRLELDSPESLLPSDGSAPPLLTPDPETWAVDWFVVSWASFGPNYTLELGVDSFTIIPEPTSLALLSLGGLLIARRRR